MNELLVAAGLGGAVGAVAGAALTAYVAARRTARATQDKAVVDTTLQCYQEFLSREMREARVKAEAVLRRNEESAEPKSFDQLASTCDIESWEAVTRLVHYFEQVAVLHSLGSLDLTVARRTLGPYFVRYYDHYLDALGSRTVATATDARGKPADTGTDASWHAHLAGLNAALRPAAGRWSPSGRRSRRRRDRSAGG
nr:hypothetical protein [Micromonospora sp. DSM 115978]